MSRGTPLALPDTASYRWQTTRWQIAPTWGGLAQTRMDAFPGDRPPEEPIRGLSADWGKSARLSHSDTLPCLIPVPFPATMDGPQHAQGFRDFMVGSAGNL